VPGPRIEIIDGKEYVVTTLPKDWRLTPSEGRKTSSLEQAHAWAEGCRDSEAQAEGEEAAQGVLTRPARRANAHPGLTGRSGPLPFNRR
jgi:hypothetical protein